MPPFEFELHGPVTPKARPRVSGRRAYLPKNYRRWKDRAITDLKNQWGDRLPLGRPVAISIWLQGKHSRRGDLDNIGGSVLDAMQGAGVLRNDNCKAVPSLLIRLNWDKDLEPITTITITAIGKPQKVA